MSKDKAFRDLFGAQMDNLPAYQSDVKHLKSRITNLEKRLDQQKESMVKINTLLKTMISKIEKLESK